MDKTITSIIIGVSLVLLTGYVLNIVKLVKLDFASPYKAEVIRFVSVPTGLGGIVGFVKIKD